MSPELKQVLDYVIAFMSASGLGAAVLAYIGVMRARAEKPHIAEMPTPLPSSVSMANGLLLSQDIANAFTMAIQDLAQAHKENVKLQREQMLHNAEEASQRRAHEREVAGSQHHDMKLLTDAVDTLNNRVRNINCTK